MLVVGAGTSGLFATCAAAESGAKTICIEKQAVAPGIRGTIGAVGSRYQLADGVDIKADKGTAVKSMNHGTVTKVWEDTLWGYSVTIDHGNGIVGHYHSLTSAVAVAEGDEVNSGDIIGYVGETAAVESTLGAHLHFAIKKNGEWIDPIGYINPLGIK